MKQLVIFISIVVLIGCIKKQTAIIFKPPTNCTVTQIGTITVIMCPDGSTATVSDGVNGTNGSDGQDGSNGNNGLNGSNGHSAAFSVVSAGIGLCSNGGSVISLGIDFNDNAVLDLSETSQVAVICNGIDGTNGSNAAPTPFTPVGIVDVCGDAPGIDDEVFLRLSNGSLLWSESQNVNGLNTRLALGRSGTWTTTDGDNCVFTLDASLNITYENHHY